MLRVRLVPQIALAITSLYGCMDRPTTILEPEPAFAVISTGAKLPAYEIVDLGGGTARGINDRGQVVGWGPNGAFLWDAGTMSNLGAPGSRAFAVNKHGHVVGEAPTAAGQTHATLWRDGEAIDLGTLPGGDGSVAVGINDRGQVVGGTDAGDGLRHAFVWEDGVMIDLGFPERGWWSGAVDVNRSGIIVGGWETFAEGDFQGSIWVDGNFIDFGWTFPVGINDRGQIVGSAPFEAERHAFLLHEGEMMDLGTVSGTRSSIANEINEHGQVVGFSGLSAFTWHRGEMLTLPNLGGGWDASRAFDVNKCGVIAGEALFGPGSSRAVIWQPMGKDAYCSEEYGGSSHGDGCRHCPGRERHDQQQGRDR